MPFKNIIDIKSQPNVTVNGFVTNIRDKQNICFFVIEDVSSELQVTILKNDNLKVYEQVKNISLNSYVTIKGKIVSNPNVKLHGRELIPTNIEVHSIAHSPMPLDTTSLLEQKLNYRWIDLRSKKNILVFQVRSFILNKLRTFLLKKKFMEINTPKLIASASESGSEVFEIPNYFGKKAYLAQSPQFYKQMAIAAGFEKVFEVGAIFRAENSNTTKHATEFVGFDVEFSNVNDVKEIMKLEQDMLRYAICEVKKKYGQAIKELFGIEIIDPLKKFPIITLKKLFQILQEKYNYSPPISQQNDLSSEAEKLAGTYAKNELNSDFLFVIEYDKDVRPFYHYRDINQIPQGFDLLYKGVEITSGAKREHRIDVIKQQAQEKSIDKDIEFYLEFFKYGIAPHGGFGLGFDRLVMLIFNITIKEACLCFRSPDRLTP